MPHQNLSSQKLECSRQLRRNLTDAEQKLWSRLKQAQILNTKFRRQTPIGRYIVDFVSFDACLVIELDGGQHNENRHHQRDLKRDVWLKEEGFLILRFWNNDVLSNIEGVLEEIVSALPPTQPSPTRGEGKEMLL